MQMHQLDVAMHLTTEIDQYWAQTPKRVTRNLSRYWHMRPFSFSWLKWEDVSLGISVASFSKIWRESAYRIRLSKENQNLIMAVA